MSLVAADSSDLALAIVMAGGVCEEVKHAEEAVEAAVRVLSSNEATVVNPSFAKAPSTRRSEGEALADVAAIVRAHIEMPSLETVRRATEH